jgi:hypothetical protein
MCSVTLIVEVGARVPFENCGTVKLKIAGTKVRGAITCMTWQDGGVTRLTIELTS